MSYPKKIVKVQSQSASKLPADKREKLLAIQEREQLKGLLVNKFLEKYGKEKKTTQDSVNKHVNEFMRNEKVTEENLKKLEQRIREGANIKSQAPLSQKGEIEVTSPKAISVKSVRSVKHEHHRSQENIGNYYDDAVSVTSSQRPRSIYAQGDEDDEWATILRYDAELFKREKALEKAREQEQKIKIKAELDRQLEQKRMMKEQEDDELRRYVGLVDRQMGEFDRREDKKGKDMYNKVMQEKMSRDRQLQEENLRKRMERKNEKEMDELLVRQIKNELSQEAQNFAIKRHEDRENFKKVLIDNEEKKKKMLEDARREKEADVRAQQEYTRLIEKQEADRAAEVKAREDRAKKFMSMMADTVVKDQRAQILAAERMQLEQYMDKEARDAEEDRRRQQRLTDQKKDVKKYLDLQMQEKERRKEEEREVGRKQAEIWKKDTNDYNDHEKKKADYIKDVNMHHADFLKNQIEEERKKHKKMNTQELLLNKPKLKEIADKVTDQALFQKQLVNPNRY